METQTKLRPPQRSLRTSDVGVCVCVCVEEIELKDSLQVAVVSGGFHV